VSPQAQRYDAKKAGRYNPPVHKRKASPSSDAFFIGFSKNNADFAKKLWLKTVVHRKKLCYNDHN